jgi:aminoglycoside phosphotransferase (APT) family kinase protein
MHMNWKHATARAVLLERSAPNPRGRFLRAATDERIAASAADVAPVLLDYFKGRFGLGNLAFAEEPEAFPDGWETYNYHFRLQSEEPLPPNFGQPLAVRIYCGPTALSRARREFAVHRHLFQLDYPVAAPFFLEEDCAYLDGPFLVMAQVHGRPLLHALLRRPWRLLRAPVQMAEVQARLHRLTTDGFPALPGSLLVRRLDELATVIEDHHLEELRPGLDWLCVNQPNPPAKASILHLDFHPLNLIVNRDRALVVLDWSEADLGDPHADVGTSVMFMECLPPIKITRLQRLAILAGRCIFLSKYLSAYRRHLPLEEEKLAYYRALAAFRRLCNYGRWLQDGPEVSGNKPSMLECVTAKHCHALERYFTKWTTVRIQL